MDKRQLHFAIIQPMVLRYCPGQGNLSRKGDHVVATRRFAAVVTVSSLIAGSFFALLFSTGKSQAKDPSGICEGPSAVWVLPSPVAPWKGAPLRVLFVAEHPLEGELSLTAPDGKVSTKSRERHGGPPYFWLAEVASPAAGTWRATLARDRAPASCSTITREIAVRAVQPPRPSSTPGSVWPLRNTWNRATENLFSAWIEKLFDDPLDVAPSWPALHEVLRDRSRNVLFNHLGVGEDQAGIVIRPDCADLPYFLRAYFAFKMGLPFGYASCSRGGAGAAPKCPTWSSIQSFAEGSQSQPELDAANPLRALRAEPANGAPKRAGLAASFGRYLPTLANGVHSGNGRTLWADNSTD